MDQAALPFERQMLALMKKKVFTTLETVLSIRNEYFIFAINCQNNTTEI